MAVWPGKGSARLAAISAADGSSSTLWEGKFWGTPQLSPGGRSVSYTKRVSRDPIADELWHLSLLFQAQSRMQSPLWASDGKGIVYLSDRLKPGAAVDLWYLRIADGKAVGFPERPLADHGFCRRDSAARS